jgi:hypothetical protein
MGPGYLFFASLQTNSGMTRVICIIGIQQIWRLGDGASAVHHPGNSTQRSGGELSGTHSGTFQHNQPSAQENCLTLKRLPIRIAGLPSDQFMGGGPGRVKPRGLRC